MINTNMRFGVLANGKHSFHDFDLYIKEQLIDVPAKRVNIVTVPYMVGHYDFSKISGDLVYDSRKLTFKFDVLEDTMEATENVKSAILTWLNEIHDDEIYIDSIPDWHFKGSCTSISWSEDEEYGEITVEFTCYPFKIKNVASIHSLTAGTHYIYNDGRKVKPTVVTSTDMAVQVGSTVTGVNNTTKVLTVALDTGVNTVIVTGSGTMNLSFVEEVI